MDWWRYNVHSEKGVDFFQANAHYWKTETDQIVGLFISEYFDNGTLWWCVCVMCRSLTFQSALA